MKNKILLLFLSILFACFFISCELETDETTTENEEFEEIVENDELSINDDTMSPMYSENSNIPIIHGGIYAMKTNQKKKKYQLYRFIAFDNKGNWKGETKFSVDNNRWKNVNIDFFSWNDIPQGGVILQIIKAQGSKTTIKNDKPVYLNDWDKMVLDVNHNNPIKLKFTSFEGDIDCGVKFIGRYHHTNLKHTVTVNSGTEMQFLMSRDIFAINGNEELTQTVSIYPLYIMGAAAHSQGPYKMSIETSDQYWGKPLQDEVIEELSDYYKKQLWAGTFSLQDWAHGRHGFQIKKNHYYRVSFISEKGTYWKKTILIKTRP